MADAESGTRICLSYSDKAKSTRTLTSVVVVPGLNGSDSFIGGAAGGGGGAADWAVRLASP